MNSFEYIHQDLAEKKRNPFHSLNIVDAFQLGANIANFVYYGKTRLETLAIFRTSKTLGFNK